MYLKQRKRNTDKLINRYEKERARGKQAGKRRDGEMQTSRSTYRKKNRVTEMRQIDNQRQRIWQEKTS